MNGAEQQDRLAELLIGILNARWRKFTLELKRCQTGFAEESVHDLRVSIRRLNATLNFIRNILPEDRLQKMRRELSKLLGAFSPLRDVQVQMLSLVQLLATYPSLQPLYTVLVLRERKLMKRGVRLVAKARASDHARTIAWIRRSLRTVLRDPSTAARRQSGLIATAGAAFARAVQMKELMEPAQPVTIHRLRVAFKKFRYTVEMLQSMLPWITKEHLKAMNAYQVRMGEIQDIEVFTATINHFASGHRAGRNNPLLPLHQELARKRAELIEAFLASSDELNGFWKVPEGTPVGRLTAGQTLTIEGHHR